jgi:hypothetical protein
MNKDACHTLNVEQRRCAEATSFKLRNVNGVNDDTRSAVRKGRGESMRDLVDSGKGRSVLIVPDSKLGPSTLQQQVLCRSLAPLDGSANTGMAYSAYA